MIFDAYVDHTRFLITNCWNMAPHIADQLQRLEADRSFLFGYCFLHDAIVKNGELTKDQHRYIANNHSTISGIFAAISKTGNTIRVTLDPLVQYSVFYYCNGREITFSNDIFLISKLHGLRTFDDHHLFDIIAYQSPLRGLTTLSNVCAVQHDDLSGAAPVNKHKPSFPHKRGNLTFDSISSSPYSGGKYADLLRIYIANLNRRARIVAERFAEVHCQLTGGADSRLVLSSFMKYDNVYYYCYGDGTSQNRLCYEALVKSLNLKKSKEILFCGQALVNSSLIFRGLRDTNCRKLNTLNTYMNSDAFVYPDKCKITGYYGANISGGVVLPPSETRTNARTSPITPECFTYHDYVTAMKTRHGHLRRAAFNDAFYINNRGPSHYAAHSLADNLKSHSFDILYDPINLELVRKCPYDDAHIDKNAISVDLIYVNHPSLALFPYEGRTIPRYREFRDTPLLNCFDGLEFAQRDLPSMTAKRPSVNIAALDILNKGAGYASVGSMLGYDECADIFNRYPSLAYLKDGTSSTSTLLLYYIFSTILCNHLAGGR